MSSLSRMAAITGKELKQLSRDRLTFGMVVMLPLIQLLLFGYAINTVVRNVPIAVVDLDLTDPAATASEAIRHASLALDSCGLVRPSLEDVFVAATDGGGER